MKKKDILCLAASIALCEAVGGLGSLFTTPAIGTWYARLNRPAVSPPNWVFGPVWTTLFAMMGVAVFLVWRRGLARRGVKLAVALFSVQLALNLLWSVLFFGLQRPDLALVEIVVLWLAIAATTAAFARLSRPAAWLMVPYLLWVSFAAYLNYSFWALNR